MKYAYHPSSKFTKSYVPAGRFKLGDDVTPPTKPITCAGASNSIKVHLYMITLEPGQEHQPTFEQVKVNGVIQTEPPTWLVQTLLPEPSFPAPVGYTWLSSILMTNTSSEDKRIEHLYTPVDVVKTQQQVIFEDNSTSINELAINGRIGYCLSKKSSSTPQCHIFDVGELDYLKNTSTGLTTRYKANFPIGDNLISINGNIIDTSTDANGRLVLADNPYVQLSYVGNNVNEPGFFRKTDPLVTERLVLQICSAEPVPSNITPFWDIEDGGPIGSYTSRRDPNGHETAIFVFNTPRPVVISCEGASSNLRFERFVGRWDMEVDGVFYQSSVDDLLQNWITANLSDIMFANYDGFMIFGNITPQDHRIRFIPKNSDSEWGSPSENQTFMVQPDGSLTVCLKGFSNEISCAGATPELPIAILMPVGGNSATLTIRDLNNTDLETNVILQFFSSDILPDQDFVSRLLEVGLNSSYVGRIDFETLEDTEFYEDGTVASMFNIKALETDLRISVELVRAQDINPDKFFLDVSPMYPSTPTYDWVVRDQETVDYLLEACISGEISNACTPNTIEIENTTLGVGGTAYIKYMVTIENSNIHDEVQIFDRVDNPASTPIEDIIMLWTQHVNDIYPFVRIYKGSNIGIGINFIMSINPDTNKIEINGFTDQVTLNPISITFVRTTEEGDMFNRMFPNISSDTVTVHTCGTAMPN